MITISIKHTHAHAYMRTHNVFDLRKGAFRADDSLEIIHHIANGEAILLTRVLSFSDFTEPSLASVKYSAHLYKILLLAVK